MEITVAVKDQNGRVVVEQLTVANETRQAFRGYMGLIASRLELSTFGPPGPVEEMTAEDKPVGHA